jgi:hypothetical protein
MDFSYRHGTLSVPTGDVATGSLPLVVHVADYQELKNMEDVGPVLPNTRILKTHVSVR